ncbi:MAG: hypothetical protein K8S16_05730, partial [Bacteroidales bacterium]|nr:hypothetical protein [Bacteroidales bacterium]
GLNLKGDDVKFEPNLPKHWRTMQFGFDFKGVRYKCKITHEAVIVWENDKLYEEVEIINKNKK